MDLIALQSSIEGFVSGITNMLTVLGLTVCVVGIVVGGLMRATSFGNERKVAQSNQAIAAAVIGLIIVLLAGTIGTAVATAFPV